MGFYLHPVLLLGQYFHGGEINATIPSHSIGSHCATNHHLQLDCLEDGHLSHQQGGHNHYHYHHLSLLNYHYL